MKNGLAREQSFPLEEAGHALVGREGNSDVLPQKSEVADIILPEGPVAAEILEQSLTSTENELYDLQQDYRKKMAAANTWRGEPGPDQFSEVRHQRLRYKTSLLLSLHQEGSVDLKKIAAALEKESRDFNRLDFEEVVIEVQEFVVALGEAVRLVDELLEIPGLSAGLHPGVTGVAILEKGALVGFFQSDHLYLYAADELAKEFKERGFSQFLRMEKGKNIRLPYWEVPNEARYYAEDKGIDDYVAKLVKQSIESLRGLH